MDYKFLFSLIIISTISISSAYSQEPFITIFTNNEVFQEGDTIVISGKVQTVIGDTPITLQILRGDNLVEIAQINVAQDGSYSHTIIAEGPLWRNSGEYIARALYGEGNLVEANFSFLESEGISQVTDIFEVDAGNQGTFDIPYSINGGSLEKIEIDEGILGLRIQIDSKTAGAITLELPREFVGAEKQNGGDEVFIILIDNLQVDYDELESNSDTRKISFVFEKGDSEIQIIGTYVIPEFGQIAILILTSGIILSIVAVRSKMKIIYS